MRGKQEAILPYRYDGSENHVSPERCLDDPEKTWRSRWCGIIGGHDADGVPLCRCDDGRDGKEEGWEEETFPWVSERLFERPRVKKEASDHRRRDKNKENDVDDVDNQPDLPETRELMRLDEYQEG